MKAILYYSVIILSVFYPLITTADLCKKCSGKFHDAATGKCQKCRGDTSSTAFCLCRQCSATCEQCECCKCTLTSKKDEQKTQGKAGSSKKKPSDTQTADPVKIAESFWNAVKEADTTKMAGYYADSVIIIDGSELRRPSWGLKTEETDSGLHVASKADLIKAYETLMDKVGRNVWRKRFDEVSPRVVSTEIAKSDNYQLNGVKAGDVIMKVTTMVGSECFYYVWRKDSAEQWRIVIELADY